MSNPMLLKQVFLKKRIFYFNRQQWFLVVSPPWRICEDQGRLLELDDAFIGIDTTMMRSSAWTRQWCVHRHGYDNDAFIAIDTTTTKHVQNSLAVTTETESQSSSLSCLFFDYFLLNFVFNSYTIKTKKYCGNWVDAEARFRDKRDSNPTKEWVLLIRVRVRAFRPTINKKGLSALGLWRRPKPQGKQSRGESWVQLVTCYFLN